MQGKIPGGGKNYIDIAEKTGIKMGKTAPR